MENIESNPIEKFFSQIEEQWSCPINKTEIKNPVTTKDGHTYEKQAIRQWFFNSNRSPKTGLNLSSTQLIPNTAFKSLKQKIIKYWPQLQRQFDKLESMLSMKNNQIQLLLLKINNQINGLQQEGLTIFVKKILEFKKQNNKTTLLISSLQKQIYRLNKVVEERQLQKLKIQGLMDKIKQQNKKMWQQSFNMKNKVEQGKLDHVETLKQVGSQYIQRNPQKGLQYFKKGLQMIQSIQGKGKLTFQTANLQQYIGRCYQNMMNYESALQMYQLNLKYVQSLKNQNTVEYSNALMKVATAELGLKRFNQSEIKLNKALFIFQKLGKTVSYEYGLLLSCKGNLFFQKQQYQMAEQIYVKSIFMFSLVEESESDICGAVYSKLAQIYLKQGENQIITKQIALQYIKKSFYIFEKIYEKQTKNEPLLINQAKKIQKQILQSV